MNRMKLGEILSVKHGWAFKGEYFAEDGEQSILTPGNFFEKGGFKPNNGKERYYTGTYPKEYLCHKGDLIVAMTQQAEGLLGSTALVPENNKYLHNQRIGLITCDEKRLNKLFAYYLFMTKSVREQLERSSSGTKVKHTSPEKIYDVEVEIPDVISQQKIANLLWSVDEKIANNKAINDNLEQQMHLIFENMMAKVANHKLSGEYTIAQNLTTVVTGKEDANFSVPNGKYKFFTCSNTPLLCDDYVFDSSSILIAGNGNFNVKHYSGKFNAYQRTYVLTPDKKYFGLLYLASLYRINSFKSRSSGSIVKFITKSDVENIPVFIPNDVFYLQELNKLIYLQEQNKLENELLVNLRDWLLPMLMNGQATIGD
ncbi:MAG: restriction endonuclease subunit S [Anaerostipes hadrus]|nr:restriction endonuclease subunit S [Anaerostipes hadrus]